MLNETLQWNCKQDDSLRWFRVDFNLLEFKRIRRFTV